MVSLTEGALKGKFYRAKNILIATGCKMRRIPGLKCDGVRVMTSREALAGKTLPKSIIVVGHHAVNPPSTTRLAPVMYDDASLARNTAAPA